MNDKLLMVAGGIGITLLAWNLSTTQDLAVEVSAFAENSSIRLTRLEEWMTRLSDRVGNLERKE
jgi:hypothetical protein